MQGMVKWFDSKRGFGIIESEGKDYEGKDYFVHISNIEKNSNLEKGDKVFFEPEESLKVTKAVKVRKTS